jgi:hypothetical protein
MPSGPAVRVVQALFWAGLLLAECWWFVAADSVNGTENCSVQAGCVWGSWRGLPRGWNEGRVGVTFGHKTQE